MPRIRTRATTLVAAGAIALWMTGLAATPSQSDSATRRDTPQAGSAPTAGAPAAEAGSQSAASGAAQASATAAARPPITGIAHVAFRVSDIAAARRFYGEVLGLLPWRSTATIQHGRVWLRVSHRQAIVLQPGLPAGTDERLSHLAFETSDLPALEAYLASRGITPDTSPAAADACDVKGLRVRDPDGHLIEFVPRPGPESAGAEAAAADRPMPSRMGLPGRFVAPRALSSRVLHAGLTVRDAAAADRFYKDTLGFSEIWRGGRTDAETSWINMRVPHGTDYLEYMLVSGTVSRQQLGVLHHVALLVPDIQTAYETVVQRTPAAARAALAVPQVGRNKRWQLNLYDPDGTRTELMEPFTMR